MSDDATPLSGPMARAGGSGGPHAHRLCTRRRRGASEPRIRLVVTCRGAGLTPAPLVDPDEIISGGPPPDGIPPIDEPQFLPPDDADFLEPQEPVLAVEVNGDARAYPLQIMIWHEIVNDRIGGAHLRRGEPRQIRGGGDGHADGHAIHRAAGHRHQMSAA